MDNETLVVTSTPPSIPTHHNSGVILSGEPGVGKAYTIDTSGFGKHEIYREIVTARQESLLREYHFQEQMIFDDFGPIPTCELEKPQIGMRKVNHKAKARARARNKAARKARRKG